jgi:peptide/nickel transport system permease protein
MSVTSEPAILTAADAAIAAPPRRRGALLRRFAEYRPGLFGAVIVAVFALVALFAAQIAPYGPFEEAAPVLVPPGEGVPLGSDSTGRDVLSSLIYGTRVALLFGVGVAGISLVLGVILGSIPAYFGGVVDDVFSRFYEFVLVIPQLVLIIVVTAFFGGNIIYTMIVVALTFWPANARITRAQVLSLRERTFVRAAVASGAGPFRVLFRHILPNGLYPVVANSTLQMGYAILFEASLSFLGLGDPNHPSWGQLLTQAQLRPSAWWLVVFPGLAIMILVLGFNLMGDGVNHAINPRLRRKRVR